MASGNAAASSLVASRTSRAIANDAPLRPQAAAAATAYVLPTASPIERNRPLRDSVVPSHLMFDPNWFSKRDADIQGADLVTELTKLIRLAPYEQLSAYASNPWKLLEESRPQALPGAPNGKQNEQQQQQQRGKRRPSRAVPRPPSRRPNAAAATPRAHKQYTPSPLGKGRRAEIEIYDFASDDDTDDEQCGEQGSITAAAAPVTAAAPRSSALEQPLNASQWKQELKWIAACLVEAEVRRRAKFLVVMMGLTLVVDQLAQTSAKVLKRAYTASTYGRESSRGASQSLSLLNRIRNDLWKAPRASSPALKEELSPSEAEAVRVTGQRGGASARKPPRYPSPISTRAMRVEERKMWQRPQGELGAWLHSICSLSVEPLVLSLQKALVFLRTSILLHQHLGSFLPRFRVANQIYIAPEDRRSSSTPQCARRVYM